MRDSRILRFPPGGRLRGSYYRSSSRYPCPYPSSACPDPVESRMRRWLDQVTVIHGGPWMPAQARGIQVRVP